MTRGRELGAFCWLCIGCGQLLRASVSQPIQWVPRPSRALCVKLAPCLPRGTQSIRKLISSSTLVGSQQVSQDNWVDEDGDYLLQISGGVPRVREGCQVPSGRCVEVNLPWPTQDNCPLSPLCSPSWLCSEASGGFREEGRPGALWKWDGSSRPKWLVAETWRNLGP